MKRYHLPIIFISLFVIGCKTEKAYLDSVWENPDFEDVSFKKIAVFGLVESDKNRKDFEKDAVKYFKKKGIEAEAGYQILGTVDDIVDMGSDSIKRELFRQGFDGVLSTKVLETSEEELPEDSIGHISRHKNDIYRYEMYFTPRYDHLQNNIQKNYAVIESNFYFLQDNSNFEGRGLIWISHYKMENDAINHIDIEIDNYAKIIVQSLFDDQVIIPE
ncbi:MAG: hypothetical protein JXR07_05210 [Reichenbachiella sp.]